MKKILVVDDLEEVRELVEITLLRAKYTILTAENGFDAVKIAKEQKPDLVIMDIAMPGKINGLEAIRLLKGDPTTEKCPIIVLTGLCTSENFRNYLEAGAHSCFSKPFSPLKLIQEVENLLVELDCAV
ncbi:response regulator [Desulfomonile tiedjei]|uniref:Response regulator with CheY-like receiver, AAA-type ATPase, and DNA-binding domains n=1 Tax=Desulfomonile tiedjei (strain ATCC 49306 / DSM 6799 / DCB-1) TaxID=706587 RepID=I4CDC8_DESTA|nr:response regulator [Desulfomonile tiedjei]AFM27569.1 response regulator with CheY-like receiver, AAA-type ATPase, and DNA-binding domains [Desulfomonile tiedjei DSM 6799]